VLPFDNRTGDAALDQPGADLVSSLNRVLSEAPNLALVAQRSADSYAGSRGDAREIARALDASHLIETRAIRSGDDIKISAELIDGRLGFQVWSKDFLVSGKDFIRTRDPVLLAIAAVVGSSGGSTVFNDREPVTGSVDAYIAWLRGLKSMIQLSDPGFVAALQYFKSATDIDPDFALAWMTTAAVHAQMMSIGIERPDSAMRFREAADRARQSQPDSKFAHAAFARVAAAHGDWLAAEEHFQAAIAEGISSDNLAAGVYLQTGRLREAEHDLRRLYADSPGDPGLALTLAVICSLAGKVEESQTLADQAVRTGIPDNINVMYVIRANSAELAGRHAEAADQMMMALDPAVRAAGGDEAVHLYYEALGKPALRPRALTALKRLEPLLSHERYGSYFTRMLLLYWNARLGAMDQAYRLADDWVAQYRGNTLVGVPHLAPLWSPDLREFRADPRFAKFATNLGLMDYWKKRGPPNGCRLDGEKLGCS
jgi:TolB-like protein